MGADIQQLLLRIDASTELARRELTRLNGPLDDLDRRAGRGQGSVGGLEGALGKLRATAGPAAASLAAVAAVQLVQFAVRSAAAFQQLEAQLETATGSAATAGVAFDQLKVFAAETPFSLQEVTKAFVLLKNLGLDPSQEALRSYGNTAGALGKTLDDVVQAVADATVGEFERLKEFGIKASAEGDRVTFTFRGVSTTVAKEAAAIERYLQQIGNVQFAGGMERQAKTIDGQLSNLKDSAERLGATFANITGFSAGFQASIQTASQGLSDLERLLKEIDDLNLLDKAGAAFDRAAGVDPPKRRTGPSPAERARADSTLENLRRQGLQNTSLFASLQDDYRNRFGIAADVALFEEPEITVSASRFKPPARTTRSSVRSGPREPSLTDLRTSGFESIKDVLAQPVVPSLINTEELAIARTELAEIATLAGQVPTIKAVTPEVLEISERFNANLAQGLAQAIVQGQSLGDALVNSLKAAAAELIASGLLKLLGGALGGGGIIGAIGSLLGFADGGRPPVGRVSVVGERGPELFVPRVPGEVIPNHKLGLLGGGGGGEGSAVDIRVQPSPLFEVTVVRGSARVSRAVADDRMAAAQRRRLPSSMGA
jgi:hypothetical protein